MKAVFRLTITAICALPPQSHAIEFVLPALSDIQQYVSQLDFEDPATIAATSTISLLVLTLFGIGCKRMLTRRRSDVITTSEHDTRAKADGKSFSAASKVCGVGGLTVVALAAGYALYMPGTTGTNSDPQGLSGAGARAMSPNNQRWGPLTDLPAGREHALRRVCQPAGVTCDDSCVAALRRLQDTSKQPQHAADDSQISPHSLPNDRAAAIQSLKDFADKLRQGTISVTAQQFDISPPRRATSDEALGSAEGYQGAMTARPPLPPGEGSEVRRKSQGDIDLVWTRGTPGVANLAARFEGSQPRSRADSKPSSEQAAPDDVPTTLPPQCAASGPGKSPKNKDQHAASPPVFGGPATSKQPAADGALFSLPDDSISNSPAARPAGAPNAEDVSAATPTIGSDNGDNSTWSAVLTRLGRGTSELLRLAQSEDAASVGGNDSFRSAQDGTYHSPANSTSGRSSL